MPVIREDNPNPKAVKVGNQHLRKIMLGREIVWQKRRLGLETIDYNRIKLVATEHNGNLKLPMFFFNEEYPPDDFDFHKKLTFIACERMVDVLKDFAFDANYQEFIFNTFDPHFDQSFGFETFDPDFNQALQFNTFDPDYEQEFLFSVVPPPIVPFVQEFNFNTSQPTLKPFEQDFYFSTFHRVDAHVIAANHSTFRDSITINVYICDTVSNSSVRVSPWPPWPQIENITAPEAWAIFMNDAIEQNFEPGTARRGSLYRSDVNHNGALNAIPLANYDLRYPTDLFLFINSVFTNRVIVNLRFVELAAFRRLHFETPATRTRTVTVNTS